MLPLGLRVALSEGLCPPIFPKMFAGWILTTLSRAGVVNVPEAGEGRRAAVSLVLSESMCAYTADLIPGCIDWPCCRILIHPQN